MEPNVQIHMPHTNGDIKKEIKKIVGNNNALSVDSDLEISSINNDTESTTLSILKDIVSVPPEENDVNGTLYQHYFINHMNNLPSRNVGNAFCRRLSQCREEDEEDDKKDIKEQVPSNSQTSLISGSDKSLSESSSGSKNSVIDTITGPKHKFVITKTKQPSEAAKIFAKRKEYRQSNTVHGDDFKRPSIYAMFNRTTTLQSPHYDRRFFDSSLIEMKSQTSSTSALDYEISEDIWIRRNSKDAGTELGSQPLPIITTDDLEPSPLPRPRSGTWGSKSDSKHTKEKEGTKHKSKYDSKADSKNQKEKKKDKQNANRSGSTSRSNSAERRKSEDVQSPKKAGMLDAFRTRSHSDAAKKKSSMIMATMRNAMLHTGLMHARPKTPRDGSAHPVRDGSSHTQYYHTVTAASTNRSPMTKVMDIFRNRSHASVPPEDRRKNVDLDWVKEYSEDPEVDEGMTSKNRELCNGKLLQIMNSGIVKSQLEAWS
ncbi:hypothetical protein FQA39_LY12045 [Lamprigera yunnana]|nr:hypothetical protein FQA39_LY12045 [Lamprigera yunnana]